VPKISSAQVGGAIRFRRRLHDLVALPRSARCGMMNGWAASTGLSECDERVRPETVPQWHRDLPARRQPGTRESGWGYRRINGELLGLGIRTAASTVREILQQAGIDPAHERTSTTCGAVPGPMRRHQPRLMSLVAVSLVVAKPRSAPVRRA
jgi:hypothetical protein